MNYAFLALFAVSTIIHLIASLKGNRKVRNITKGFILTGLIGFYLLTTSSINVLFLLALIFSLLGDLLLIKQKLIKFFIFGGVAFMLSHLFFIISMYQAPTVDYLVIFLGIIGYLLLFIFTSARFRKDKLSIGISFYLFMNLMMNIASFTRGINMMSAGNMLGLCGIIGAGLFYASDTMLFEKRNNYSNLIEFLVMFTYAFGELLLVISFIV